MAQGNHPEVLPRPFLVQMARDRELSPDQEAVFLRRFADRQNYDAIAHQLNTSAGACLKRMGQVYKKFGTGGGTRGKEHRLRHFLHQQYQQQTFNLQPDSPEGRLSPSDRLRPRLSAMPKALRAQETQPNHPPKAVPARPVAAAIPRVANSAVNPDERAFPEFPAGQVNLNSRFYVERPPIERRCYEEILQPGALIRIKAPRQMGKTSLLARILERARSEGYRKVNLSFQLADRSAFDSLDSFLQWFCASIGRSLQLPNRLAEYWDNCLGSKVNCKFYFEQYLLKSIAEPLALGLDEVDRVFQYGEIAEDFLSLLRSWHEEGKRSDTWKKLRLAIAHSTEIYILMDINQSPFHVGLPIELPEFAAGQVQDLAQRYGLQWSLGQAQKLMNLVSGHPFLIQVALYHIARGDVTLEQLAQSAIAESSIYNDHLRRHLWNLEQYPDLAATMAAVVAAKSPIKLAAAPAFKLHSMGLIRLANNKAAPRCSLYRQYFQKCLDLPT